MFGSLLGGIVGGFSQASAAKNAAKISRESLAQQKEQLDKSWSAVDPYMTAGAGAVANLTNPNAFMTSPGYNFRMQQGLDAVNTNSAVKGLLRSGSALKGVNSFAQGLASDEYNKWFDQQSRIAGMGLQGAGIGSGVSTNIANAIGQDADNRANAGLSGANAWAQLAGTVGGAWDRMSSYGG